MWRSTATTAPDPRHARRRGQRGRIVGAALAVAAVAGLAGLWCLDHAIRRAERNLAIPAASTLVVDRDGRLLRPFATREGRWSLPATSADVDPRFTALLLAVEDRTFARNGGVDPRAALRAAAQWLTHGHIVSGASTLSMQVARLLAPRAGRSLRIKAGQAIRALTLERRFAKPAILDLYLRLAPYGGNIQGVRAASLAWFDHEPRHLSLAEAALLVALPQAPEHRRPDRFAARAEAARNRVLARAETLGLTTPAEVAAARAEPVPATRHDLPALAFHAAGLARAGAAAGSTVTLTLDATLQAGLEALVRRHAERFGPAVSGALLVVDNADGTIMADVGTADRLSAPRAGAVDMARAFRSPGSALKPFIYAMAFEDGIAAPETLLDDRPTHYGAYAPADFDGGFQGSVTARRALQQSLNLPAVALLDRVGPARFLARLGDAGARVALPPGEPPGLAVGLGGLGIRLIDLARLYAGLARGGNVPRLTERRAGPAAPGGAGGRPVTDSVSASAVTDILRGATPPPNGLSGRIAFKTGTSYGFRDALAVGYSGRYTVAAWLGRPDAGAVPGLVGRQAAGPLLFEAFAKLAGSMDPPARPAQAAAVPAGALPMPLRRLGAAGPSTAPALRVAYPPDGAVVDLDDGSPTLSALVLKAEGGAPPFTWFVNGRPTGATSLRREGRWTPDGIGFATVSVIDATGREASVAVRLR